VPDKNKKVSPVIILPGINHSPSYLCDENGNRIKDGNGKDIGGTLMIPDVASFKKELPALAKSLARSVATHTEGDIYEKAYSCAMALTSIQRCDCEGNHINNLVTERWEYPISEMDEDLKAWAYRMVPMQALTDEIGEENLFFFTFNLVGDPMISADELKDYIEKVKARTGAEKVTLLPVSLGGTILTAYLEKYGSEGIDRIVNTVACLDGTEIVSDIFARRFNISERYLRHEFIPSLFKEETGSGTAGYAVNILLHALPRRGFYALISGFMSGLIDGVMIYCPQIWAMLPAKRYDDLCMKYLCGRKAAALKERTDAFQFARLHLKKNLLRAAENGVKIDFISGSGLDFGDVEYCIFGAVKSKDKFNTDGIIQLDSTTLGAYGVPAGGTLPDGYTQARECKSHPGYSYISPDRRVDVSTALMPDNTWIFLNQHHEVGNNSAVLNLAKCIITGEVSDVHSDPVNHPQFNFAENTYHLRRWKLGDGKRALDEIAGGEIKTAPSIRKELENAVAKGEEILGGTVADAYAAAKARKDIERILVRLGKASPEKQQCIIGALAEKFTQCISEALVNFPGSKSNYYIYANGRKKK